MTNAIEASLNLKLKDFFFKWLDITHSFHKLSKQHQKVLALLLYYHYLYKKETTNNKILWKFVFDYDTRLKIQEDSVFEKGLTVQGLNTVIHQLKKKGIIVDGKVSPRYIPVLTTDCKKFKITFNFNIVDNE